MRTSNVIVSSFGILALAYASGACDGGGTGGSGAASSTGNTGGMTSSSSSSGAAGGEPDCPGPGYGGGEATIQVDSVTAVVQDLSGAPLGDLPIQVCGLDLCLYFNTMPDGTVVANTNKMLKKPAIKYGDGLAYAKLGIVLTQAVTNVGTVHTEKLPASGPAITVGNAAFSGGLTITPAPGGIIFDELTYDTPDKQALRAVLLPIDKLTGFVDPMMGLEIVYGTAPIETVFCGRAKASVPNTPNWPAGTAVEFYLFDTEVAQEFAPYIGWAKVSEGSVTADGMNVETASDGGLPALGAALGIKKKL